MADDPVVGKVDALLGDGHVTFIRASGETVVASPGDLIFSGDTVLTTLGSSVVLQLTTDGLSAAGYVMVPSFKSATIDTDFLNNTAPMLAASSLASPLEIGQTPDQQTLNVFNAFASQPNPPSNVDAFADLVVLTYGDRDATADQIIIPDAGPDAGPDGGGLGGTVSYGGSGNDIFFGTPFDDVFVGGAGIDTANFDMLFPGVTVDLAIVGFQDTSMGMDRFESIENVMGSEFRDVISGNSDDNVLTGFYGNDTIRGRDGDDVINGQRNKDTLKGDKGNDSLKGGSGADKLFGGKGDDVLKGGKGRDVLTGGQGDDVLWGGLGADRFVFDGPDSGTDTVRGFNLVDDILAIAGQSGGFSGLAISQTSDGAQIDHTGGTIVLKGILADDVTSASLDFL